MKTVLLIGVGPLPFYESNTLYGFGIRAWQFALPILAAGHQIVLVTCEFGVNRESALQKITFKQDPTSFGAIQHIPLPEPSSHNMNLIITRIEEIIRTHQPNAIVAAGSTIATNLASSLKTDLPMWLDMFGDLFAEVQAKSPFSQDDKQFDYFHKVMTRVFLRGDRFSVVSEMQKGAAVGQLGLMGRLNRFTVGDDLISAIPCAINGDMSPVKQNPVLRGHRFSDADFLLLCSGGFNTWADVDTLFYGIEGAMEQNRRIHCVVTGGSIQGHHEDGFKRFNSLISKSPYENRFHLLGWVSNEEVAEITMECNLGLNVDLPIYESLLGSRNRILYWMQCGLPTLTTVSTELSQILQSNELGLCLPVGQYKRIAKAILDASHNPEKLKQMALRARRFVYDHFTYEETSKPLVAWVNDPVKAGDNIERINRNDYPFNEIDGVLHSWGFATNDHKALFSLPRPQQPLIRTRPQGKNWFRRLWGK